MNAPRLLVSESQPLCRSVSADYKWHEVVEAEAPATTLVALLVLLSVKATSVH